MIGTCCDIFISHGTKETYRQGQGIFLRFCGVFKLEPYAVSETELCMAVGHFALTRSVNSADSYMSAVQNLWDAVGAGPLPRGPRYHLFIRGLKRLLGAADAVQHTRALSVDDLRLIVSSLDPSSPEDCGMAAQLITAFFLALRTEDHNDGRLLVGDIFPQADGSVEFFLRPGKSTSQHRHVAISARTDILDLLPWLRRLFSFMPAWALRPARHVFASFRPVRGAQDFRPRSRGEFAFRLKALVRTVLKRDATLFSGYSLRRGGVTAMLSADKPVAAIRRHVGWAPGSSTVDLYYDDRGYGQQRLPTAGL
jgi:hypothetical protein